MFRWSEGSVEVLKSEVLRSEAKAGVLKDLLERCKKSLRYAIVAIVLTGAFSCGGKRLPSFDRVDLDLWKEDKLGCNGKRTSMMVEIDEQSDKLLALDEREIISLLGRPDENELYKRNQKFYYYFIQPSQKCSDSVNKSPKKLVIRFNAIGLAKEVSVE